MEIFERRRTPAIARLLPHAEFNLSYIYHEHDELDAAEDSYLSALKACQGMTDPSTSFLKLKINFNLIDVFQELDRFEHAYSIME